MPAGVHPAVRAASASDGGAATLRSISRRSIAAARSGSGTERPDPTPCNRTTGPSRTMRPAAARCSTAAAEALVAAVRSMVAARRSVRPAAARAAGRLRPSAPAASTAEMTAASTAAATSGARTAEPLAVVRAPWRSRRAASYSLVTAFVGPPPPPGAARRSSLPSGSGASIAPRALASRPTRSGVWRRREIPRGGVTSSTTPPTILSPPEVRRRTNRSPGLAATGVASRTIPAADPSGSSIASRPLRPTAPSTAAVPIWTRARARSGSARARADEQPVSRDHGWIVSHDEAAAKIVDIDGRRG